MEIERDVSRTVGAVELNAPHDYPPRAALGTVWEDTVTAANFRVIRDWVKRNSRSAPRVRRCDFA